eukprot:scaffold3.g6642.t1
MALSLAPPSRCFVAPVKLGLRKKVAKPVQAFWERQPATTAGEQTDVPPPQPQRCSIRGDCSPMEWWAEEIADQTASVDQSDFMMASLSGSYDGMPLTDAAGDASSPALMSLDYYH